MEPVYIIGAGAIGKVLAECLSVAEGQGVNLNRAEVIIPGAYPRIFMFKNTSLLYFKTLFYAVGPLFSAIVSKIKIIGIKSRKTHKSNK
jgi:hypothetical protein